MEDGMNPPPSQAMTADPSVVAAAVREQLTNSSLTSAVCATPPSLGNAPLAQLPVTELEMEAGLDKYKWFGRFLLEGRVVTSLEKYSTSLLSNPLIMVKTWSNLQKRTEILVRELARETCDSGDKLTKIWARDPNYLLSAFLAWLPEVIHPDVTKEWPPQMENGKSSYE